MNILQVKEELNGVYDFSSQYGVILDNRVRVDDTHLSSAFGQMLSPRMADLVYLSMAIYYADRRTKRKPESGQRIIRIKLPVRDFDFWSDSKSNDELSDLLYWLTEDQWEFEFIGLKQNSNTDNKIPLFESPVVQPNKTLLFSGGLDSLSGLSYLMEQNPDCSFVLFSGVTSSRIADIQRNIKRKLVKYWSTNTREIRTVEVRYELNNLEKTIHEEKSQRSRSFVYISLGAITAVLADSSEINICENGIGAINLPYNEGQLGIDNTRGSHPITLIRMSRFLGNVLGMKIRVINPFQFLTKGQMCRSLDKPELDILPVMTVSCDSFPLREKVSHQCGTCTSCLLRRLSLYSAGLIDKDLASFYKYDILKQFKTLDEKHIYPIMAMLDQKNKIQACLKLPKPWQSLVRVFPDLREIQETLSVETGLNLNTIAESITGLYSEYIGELERFYRLFN
jgi:7-cyano-7-deazaguanine synthase in queuosine biosynthesis